MGLSWFLHVKLSGKLSLEIAKLQVMWFGSRKVERSGALRVGGRPGASRDMGVSKPVAAVFAVSHLSLDLKGGWALDG